MQQSIMRFVKSIQFVLLIKFLNKKEQNRPLVSLCEQQILTLKFEGLSNENVLNTADFQ